MKRLFILISFITLGLTVQAQTRDHKADYERQVRMMGIAGLGVDSIINRWAEDDPDNTDMLTARFNYDFVKAQSNNVITLNQKKYLGKAPVMTLKDSLGNDVYYFEDILFDDELVGSSLKAIDKAINLKPGELRYRISKISALMMYEKESPDLAVAQINELIDLDKTTEWTFDGEKADSELFCQVIGEYCVNLFQIASPASFEYFLAISEKMSKLFPKNTVFINNIGSYWQVAKKDNKKAARFYKKALKIDPEDYAATKNMKIIEASNAASRSKKDRS